MFKIPKLRTLLFSVCLSLLMVLGAGSPAWAFCGFYVAKADTKLYNQASQVAIARDGDRTVLTMANDFQGDVKDFAMVVPVPTVLEEGQVHVGEPSIIERLDSFSAPRLVEYFDDNPCDRDLRLRQSVLESRAMPPTAAMPQQLNAQKLGVTVESQFSVGEYDILILSAKESSGLATWLKQNGYRLPRGANALLRPYIRQNLKFFVAKVNLEEFDNSGFQNLRPIQIAYESPRFMLPIRLGMMNADSDQDLIVYLMSPQGRVDLTNYRTVEIPSDEEVPVFVKNEFEDFYTSMFDRAHNQEGRRVAFLEYAWNMAGCDPCSANPLTPEELRQAGVFWTTQPSGIGPGGIVPGRRRQAFKNNVFLTRLHVRYRRDKFPEDLMFQETGNQQFFQGRYVLRHPFKGEAKCAAGDRYRREVVKRQEQEAQTLANLTGWNLNEIRRQLPKVEVNASSWWDGLWKQSIQKSSDSAKQESGGWWRSLWQ